MKHSKTAELPKARTALFPLRHLTLHATQRTSVSEQRQLACQTILFQNRAIFEHKTGFSVLTGKILYALKEGLVQNLTAQRVSNTLSFDGDENSLTSQSSE